MYTGRQFEVGPKEGGVTNDVWDVAWRPGSLTAGALRRVGFDLLTVLPDRCSDGRHIAAPSGTRILLLDASTGAVEKTLVSHNAPVFTVAFSADGKFMASGDRENFVIIWRTDDYKGLVKYPHSSTVQRVLFNPVTHALTSCSCNDFATWSATDQQNVVKTAVSSRILDASWSTDGQRLALALANGTVSIRDLNGEELSVIRRAATPWTVTWSPGLVTAAGAAAGSAATAAAAAAALPTDSLAIGCWDSTLSFFQRNGWQEGKDRPLTFDPTSLEFIEGGRYLLVAGSHGQCEAYTREGVLLGRVAKMNDWIWRVRARPGRRAGQTTHVAIATADGEVAVLALTASYVHGLWRDRYAFRDGMTDVVVQHLVTEQRMRVKCRALVKKIALYRNRLAVQVPEGINVYEIPAGASAAAPGVPSGASSGSDDGGASGDGAAAFAPSDDPAAATATARPLSVALTDPYSMRYQQLARISRTTDCNLLVVTARHVVLCMERSLVLIGLSGRQEREWVLDDIIRYIRVVGGPPGAEMLLIGLKSGAVVQVFVNNPFPSPMVKLAASVRCIDMSPSRTRLAVVDDRGTLRVYGVESRELEWEAPDTARVGAVCFNSSHDDIVAYTTGESLVIRTADFPPVEQPVRGLIVGMHRSLAFVLHHVTVRTVDLPQSESVQRFVERGDFESAYRIATLGITDYDWRILGVAALRALRIDTARLAFTRLRDVRYLDLIARAEASLDAAGLGSAARRPAAAAGTVGDDADSAAVSATALSRSGPGVEVIAESLAFEGRFKEAADALVAAGMYARAIDIYTDLRMWTEARQLAESSKAASAARRDGPAIDMNELMLMQARTCEQNGDFHDAASIFMAAGNTAYALRLWGNHGMLEQVIRIVDETEPVDAPRKQLLRLAADILSGRATAASPSSAGPASESSASQAEDATSAAPPGANKAGGNIGSMALAGARRALEKLGDDRGIIGLLAASNKWQEAIAAYSTAVLRLRARHASSPGSGGSAPSAMPSKPAADLMLQLQDGAIGSEAGLGLSPELEAERRSLAAEVFVPYAKHLALQGRFDEARSAYQRAGRADQATSLLRVLARNAVAERRFNGAARDLWRLSDALVSPADSFAAARLRTRGDMYHAFASVYDFARAPFSAAAPLTLFNASAFLLNSIAGSMSAAKEARKLTGGPSSGITAAAAQSVTTDSVEGTPLGVSQTDALYTLAKTSVGLGAYKTARAALELLATRLLAAHIRDATDMASLAVQAQPFSDRDALLPHCYRCGTHNAVLQSTGDRCSNCGAPFHRSMHSFEVLPLVEFLPERGVSIDEALEVMREAELGGGQGSSGRGASSRGGASSEARAGKSGGGVQSMSFGGAAAGAGGRGAGADFDDDGLDGSGPDGGRRSDRFQAWLTSPDMTRSLPRLGANILRVPRAVLAAQPLNQVLVVGSPTAPTAAANRRLFRVMIETSRIEACPSCRHLFYADEFELEMLRDGCPACGFRGTPAGANPAAAPAGADGTVSRSTAGRGAAADEDVASL